MSERLQSGAVVRFASLVVGQSGLCRQFEADRGGRRKVYQSTALSTSFHPRPNLSSSVFKHKPLRSEGFF
nr:MAG TPA: hypothetical protein [Caudoviricetes sp.]